MCFSVEVEREVKKLLARFRAEAGAYDEDLYHTLASQGQDLAWAKDFLGLKRRPSQNPFRFHDADGRIYPGYFAYVMVSENGKRVMKPMRYRVRPMGSKEEIPSKFNVFNARLDALEERQTWRPLFMRTHGLFPFKRFFEWVERDGKKTLISFNPGARDLMWAPCLWDQWVDPKSGLGFKSFALITDDPPEEVARMGHDRCPIFLKEEHIDQWLSPLAPKETIYRLLKDKESVRFDYVWAA